MTTLRRRLAGAEHRRLPTELRLMLLVLSTALPLIALGAMQLIGDQPSVWQWGAACGISIAWVVIVAVRVRGRALHHIRTLTNLVEAARIQDYGMRGSLAGENGELARLYSQLSSLAHSLATGRRREREALSVLEKVVGQIRVAIVVCDAQDRIQLANPQACQLLDQPAELLHGMRISETAFGTVAFTVEPRIVEHRFPGGEGRWQISQKTYRHQGLPSRILFVTDLRQVLYEEEIAAWRRLIRVIAHEVNNSLTPISSLSQTLQTLLERPDHANHREDVRAGLTVIAQRADGLRAFISEYSRIARLPEPVKRSVRVAELLARVAATVPADRPLRCESHVEESIQADPVLVEQALINLVKNALEAGGDRQAPIGLRCRLVTGYCVFEVLDRGPGIRNPENLFVPFYTTKDDGTGIGLVLCREIAARHQGHVSLENRADGPGAVARLSLPHGAQPARADP